MVSAAVKELARIADREGMWAKDVVRHKKCFRKSWLGPKDCSKGMCHEADLYNAEQLAALIKKYHFNEDPGAVWVEEETPEQERQHRLRRAAKAQREEGSGRQYVFDEWSPASVLRWMGKEGFTEEEATEAFDSLNIHVSDVTIKLQLKAGRAGKGSIPKLSPKQELTLNLFCD